jgi:membrane associated rhomboid family serine protease
MFPVQNTAPSRYPPLATWGQIAVNSAVFLVQIRLPTVEAEALIARFALIPARYCCGNADLGPADFLLFFTMMFQHGGRLHLILNTCSLWVFGRPVEDRVGPARYLLLYFACGVIAALTSYQFNPASPIPALGASGAIAGVIGCYVRLLPFRESSLSFPSCFSRSFSMLQPSSLSGSGS